MDHTRRKLITIALSLLSLCLGLLVPGVAQENSGQPTPQSNIAGNGANVVNLQEPEAYPPAFDWRNVGGYNYITPVKDQTQTCASCTVFAVIAALEANARIRLNLPENVPDRGIIDFSEAQLFFCNQRNCKNGWVAYKAREYSQRKGVISENVNPYDLEACCAYTPVKEDESVSQSNPQFQSSQQCTGCCAANIDEYEKKGQITQISGYTRIKIPEKMKQWIASKGPVVTNIIVNYTNFLSYEKGTIYRCTQEPPKQLNHAVCCIGYDERRQAWLCKKSFGRDWCMDGYFGVGYGECGVDRVMFGINGFRRIYPQFE